MTQKTSEMETGEPQLADLRAVLALLRDGTVTRAAQSLGVTQSTLSYQLDRMRQRFSDPLFVRVGNRMAATPFAQRLAEPAARVLRIVETEIAGLAAFDPASSQREFRIGMNEMGAITLLPRLMQQMTALAPRARLAPMQGDPAMLAQALESGAMDLAAGHFPQAHDLLLHQLLYKRDYVCIARRGHAAIGRALTIEQFAAAPQIRLPTVPATSAWIDALMNRHGLRVTVGMSTGHVASLPFIVAASELIAIVPRELYELFAPIAAVKVVGLPFEIPAIEIHQYWHPRLAKDPAVKFLRETLYTAARARKSVQAGP
ncbi:LysR family transcriptional regulator [Pelomonas sp. KK5]|uniref:LysR family transcriptional regulator n=1 Tax=Pelomonas sp. KK5 TaxID=1855730 RepID=UPI00097BFEC6|nr:LysR family transcriptional regulator [Pelomonas sp. KK5]